MSVTAIEVGAGIDPEALRAVARERFQVAIAGGLGPLHGRVFRIGHLGDMNEAMILGCLAGVEAALHVQGIRSAAAASTPRWRRWSSDALSCSAAGPRAAARDQATWRRRGAARHRARGGAHDAELAQDDPAVGLLCTGACSRIVSVTAASSARSLQATRSA